MKLHLMHDARGFYLADENNAFVLIVDVGNKPEEVDWDLIERQATEAGHELAD